MDLNLLLAFEALWLERSVTGAGRRLGLSQPAASAALARLRDMVGDRLFVRVRGGLDPTERCVELAGPVLQALADLRAALAGVAFDPATTSRQLRIGAVDAAIAVWIPRVIARVLREAPGARLQVVAIDPARATEALLDGEVDLALSPHPSPSAAVRCRALYPVPFVVATRPGHPALEGAPLAAFPRAQVWFAGMPPADGAVVLGSFLAVPPVLAATDAWALLPGPFAAALAAAGQVATQPPPDEHTGPPMTMQLLWPEAQDASPASRWLRELVIDATR
jgi:DNA-binding transcriptional LysR family regulator